MTGLRLLLDMNLSPALKDDLQAAGYDVAHVLDRGAGASPDPHVAALARAESRCLVTADLDFADMAAAVGGTEPSVVILRLRDPRPSVVARRLLSALPACAEPLGSGAIVTVDEVRVRVRRLPLR